MIIPNLWENKNVPNHQPDILLLELAYVFGLCFWESPQNSYGPPNISYERTSLNQGPEILIFPIAV